MPEINCLNPCFNGRYSQRFFQRKKLSLQKVLILVLMEDTLRDDFERIQLQECSLNPCFNGRYSQS